MKAGSQKKINRDRFPIYGDLWFCPWDLWFCLGDLWFCLIGNLWFCPEEIFDCWGNLWFCSAKVLIFFQGYLHLFIHTIEYFGRTYTILECLQIRLVLNYTFPAPARLEIIFFSLTSFSMIANEPLDTILYLFSSIRICSFARD